MNHMGSKPILSLIVCVALNACGSSTTFLNSVNVTTTTQNSESFVNLSAVVNLGSSALSSVSIPVVDPNSGVTLGQISMSTTPSNLEQITLSLNASALTSGSSTLGAVLPNGEALPLSLGAATGEVMGIPVLQQSRIYIGGDLKNNVIVGVALGIGALNGVAGNLPIAANIFFSNQFSTQVFGVAGIYASPVAGETGIAVFGKLNIPQPTATPAATPITSALLIAKRTAALPQAKALTVTATPAPATAEVKTSEFSAKAENKIGSFFMKKRVLHVQ